MKKNTFITAAFALLFTLGLSLGTVQAANMDTDPPKKEQKDTEPKKADAPAKTEKKGCCSADEAKKAGCGDKKAEGTTSTTPAGEAKPASCCSAKKAA